MHRIAAAVILTLSLQMVAQSASTASSNPKVRAITGFVRLDRATSDKQIAEALVVLRKAKSAFEAAGYQVESLRLTTQPLAELVAGLSEEQALAFLTQFDQLSVKENFIPNVGAAMMHDSDDPAAMHLLERALSTLPNIEGNTIIADETGIHWKTIHRTSELVKYVSEHSPRSQGTFNFTATAMLKPLAPSSLAHTTREQASNSPSALKARMWSPKSLPETKGMRNPQPPTSPQLSPGTPSSQTRLETRSPQKPDGPTSESIPPPRPLAMFPLERQSKTSQAPGSVRAEH